MLPRAGGRRGTPTLDVPERQVLIDFFDDEQDLRWHARLLLAPTPTAGVWIACSPDYEVARLDLNQHRVISLARNNIIPRAREHEAYVFDAPHDEDELRRARQEARDLLAVLGIAAAGGADTVGTWRVADPSHDEFDQELPPAVLADPAQFTATPSRGTEEFASGLALVEGAWVFVQCVDSEDRARWRHGLVCAHAHDTRTLGDERDFDSDRRFSSFRDLVNLAYEPKSPAFALQGQRVTKEMLTALYANGFEFVSHHLDFVAKSGLSPNSGTARTHRRVSEALQMLFTVDMLNLPGVAGAEVLCRYLAQIEVAVARNPRAPDFADLDIVAGSTVNQSGGLVLPAYAKYVAEIQRDEAFTLKQRRQWQEEQIALQRRSGGGAHSSQADGDGDGGRGGGRGNQRGRRNRRGRGRGRDGEEPAQAGP